MKLYILVRRDMSMSQIAVQAGHSVGEWVKTFPCSAVTDWNNTLVYLGVSDEAELNSWKDLLFTVEEKCIEWREGYWDNSLTSIGVLGTPLVQQYVKTLKLI